jgi:hypothetical protein
MAEGTSVSTSYAGQMWQESSSGVLVSSGRSQRNPKVVLSDAQVQKHGRGAQTLRNYSLFEGAIPFGFTPLPTPKSGSSTPRALGPLPPLFIRDNGAPDDSSATTFVFSRAGSPSRTPLVEPPSSTILDAFLPLPIPLHLSPHTCPSSYRALRPTASSSSNSRPPMARWNSTSSVSSIASLPSMPSSDNSTVRGNQRPARPVRTNTQKKEYENERVRLSEMMLRRDSDFP